MNKNSRLCERLKNDRLIDRLIEWLSEERHNCFDLPWHARSATSNKSAVLERAITNKLQEHAHTAVRTK